MSLLRPLSFRLQSVRLLSYRLQSVRLVSPLGPARAWWLLPMLLAITSGCDRLSCLLNTPPEVTKPNDDQPKHPPGPPITDEFGIGRKVITLRPLIPCRESIADDSAMISEPLKWFHPYFMVDTFPNSAAGPPSLVKIAKTPLDQQPLGWVSVDDTIEWKTRMAARWSKASPLLVAGDIAALQASIRSGTPVANPIARFEGSSAKAWMPWPILQSQTFEHGGQHFELAQLAFLAKPSKSAKLPYSPSEIGEFQERLRTLAITIVIDNTHSTHPHIEAMIVALTGLVEQLKALTDAPKLRISIVLYRDYVPGLYFEEDGKKRVVRVFESTNDLESLIAELRRLEAAKEGSEDLAESVYDGVDAGLEQLAAEDKLAMKVLVLCGDNSAHEPGTRGNPRDLSADDLIKRAVEQKATIYSLRVAGAGDEDERSRHRRQFEQLASGTGGECFGLDESSKVVAAIDGLIKKADEVSKKRREEFDHLRRRSASDAAASPAVLAGNQGFETVVMELLRDANIDPERLHAGSDTDGKPTHTTGWVVANINGTPEIDQVVMVARSDLDFVLGELSALCSLLNKPKGTEHIFELMVSAKTGEFFRSARPKQTFDSFLQAQGIPARSGLLRFSKDEIQGLPEAKRRALAEKLSKTYIPALQAARNDDRYFRFEADFEFGFVAVELFP